MDPMRTTRYPCGYRWTRGNALAEYTLIAMLLCLVSIAAVFSMSGAFSERISVIKSDMQGQVDGTNAQAIQMAATRAMRAGGSAILASDSSGFGGSNGKAMTTGANGDTMALTGKTGEGLADILSNLSEKEKNLVQAVANTAHEIARMQELLEQLSQYSGGDMEKFRNSQIMVDGELMTAYDLAVKLGQAGLAAQLERKTNSVLASGITDSVKGTVAAISDKVKDKATETSDITNEVLITNSDPAQVEEVSNSKETSKNAAKICKAAGGKDDGTQCGD